MCREKHRARPRTAAHDTPAIRARYAHDTPAIRTRYARDTHAIRTRYAHPIARPIARDTHAIRARYAHRRIRYASDGARDMQIWFIPI